MMLLIIAQIMAKRKADIVIATPAKMLFIKRTEFCAEKVEGAELLASFEAQLHSL